MDASIAPSENDLMLVGDAELRDAVEDLEREDPQDVARVGRRLLVAGLLISALAIASVFFLPTIIAILTPMGAMVVFIAILAGALLTAAPKKTEPARPLDDARPVSCGGPRPVGEMSRRARGGHSCGPGGCG